MEEGTRKFNSEDDLLDLIRHNSIIKKESKVALLEYKEKSLTTQAFYGEQLVVRMPAIRALIEALGEDSMNANEELAQVKEERDYLFKKIEDVDSEYLKKMSKEIIVMKHSAEEKQEKLRQRVLKILDKRQ